MELNVYGCCHPLLVTSIIASVGRMDRYHLYRLQSNPLYSSIVTFV